jgi:hypothetical protein
MIDTSKLRDALKTEAASQTILTDICRQIDVAVGNKATLLAKRAAAIAGVAAGGAAADAAKLDNALHVAERTVVILTEAFALAQLGAAEAEAAVDESILRKELAQLAAAADAEYAAAELAYKEAAARCRAAFAAAQSARGAVSLPPNNLRLYFREALADAEA